MAVRAMQSNRRHLLLSLLFHLTLLSLQPSPTTAQEAEALLRWKSTSLPPTDALSSWSSSNSTSLCSWDGITCNSTGAVVGIDLNGLDLNGTIDGLDFSAFPSLTRLNLRSNSLAGAIPANISRLSKLTHLDIGDNDLDHTYLLSLEACPTSSTSVLTETTSLE